MSYNGSGTFTINSTGQPVVAGTVITASAFNALTTDLATGLTTAITKDGQTTTTARITFAQGITSSLVTDSSSVSTGSIITAGGAGIAKNLYVGVNANVAGTLGVTGVATFSAAPIYSSLTASSAVATDASKGLVSVTNTGTGNNVLATSPTITTPTISSLSSAAATALTLQSAGTTAITVDTSQNVGVGVASGLTGKLSVGTVSYGQTSPVAQVNGASKAISNNGGIFSIGSTDAAGADIGGSLGFTANSAGNGYATGQISGRKVNGSDYSSYMAFTTCDSGGTLTEKMRLNTTGALVLAGGSTSATGTGITFPATQSASSDANTLDDYEEGTWTPTITGSSSSGTGTYTTQQGTYTKIGNIVKFQAEIVWTAHTGSGGLQVANYPFTSTAETSPISIVFYGGPTFTSGNFIQAYKNSSSTDSGTAQTSPASSFASVAVSNAGTVQVNGVYKVA